MGFQGDKPDFFVVDRDVPVTPKDNDHRFDFINPAKPFLIPAGSVFRRQGPASEFWQSGVIIARESAAAHLCAHHAHVVPADPGAAAPATRSPDKSLQPMFGQHVRLVSLLTDLAAALQWYVDNDETMDMEDNKTWLAGRERAEDVLRKFRDEIQPESGGFTLLDPREGDSLYALIVRAVELSPAMFHFNGYTFGTLPGQTLGDALGSFETIHGFSPEQPSEQSPESLARELLQVLSDLVAASEPVFPNAPPHEHSQALNRRSQVVRRARSLISSATRSLS